MCRSNSYTFMWLNWMPVLGMTVEIKAQGEHKNTHSHSKSVHVSYTHIPSHPYHSSHFTGNAEMNTKWQASVQNPFSHNAPVCWITEGWMFVSQTHMRLYNQCSWDACVLLLSKTFCLLDGKHELLLHLLVTSVRRQVQTIKTTATQTDEGDCYMLHKMVPKLSHFSVFTPGTIFDVYYTAMQPKIKIILI